MNETKSEVYHRLTQEGRWAEASSFRDKFRRERREAGDSRAVASEKAWQAMAQEFPRLKAFATSDSQQSDESSQSWLPTGLGLKAACGDFDSDIAWAWNHYGQPVEATDAPNGTAWALLVYGTECPDKFLPLVAKSIGLKGRKARERVAKDREDRDRQFALLDSIKRSFEEERARAS